MPDSPLNIGFNVPFHQAIKAAEKKGVVLPEEYYGVLQGLARQRAFSIAGIASLDQLEQVRDSLAVALNDGESFDTWKNKILENGVLDLPDYRLDNIFRTNNQSNYNRGRWQRFQEVKERRPYLMYDAINDSRVRPTHLAMDGIIRAHDDPFWNASAPSNGFRCRCRLINLSEKQAQARSGDGKGLNKPIIHDDMRPDNGWDYNPGADLTKGLEKAIEQKPPSLIKTELDTRLKVGQFIPVSDAFNIPKSGKTKGYAKKVLDIIDDVHSDGELPIIPIKGSTSHKFQGSYSHYTVSGKPIKIALSKHSRNPELTLAHEIGHFLDHQSLDVAGEFASAKSPLFKKWRDAVSKSQATKNIKAAPHSDNKEYYLKTHEQFARSYAQWVAEKSGDAEMLEQVRRITESGGDVYSNSQWANEDFIDISAAIDDIFNDLWWLK